ncbi:2,3-dihydro-2,3-dihydroxybenzoate dehydrogenase [Curvibacter sp. CHRR-16]|uniref:2,3-dihydro-2,3-dihydroxybenzoate dehydrogenase n=1 Tax=Curvibacter sp. CHRR-16 TaxID=2835872 RepID=UPI0032E9D723
MKSEKIALVTGAAQGIGAAVAELLAQNGITVAAMDVQPQGLHSLAAQWPGRIYAYPGDVRSSTSVNGIVEVVEQELGPIAMLVNTAGILRLGAVCDYSDADWEATFGVNTQGVFYVSRAVAKRMRERAVGSIVTVASNAAFVPRQQMAAYAASKAASSHFTKCLGLELAPYGIRCNVVAPGSTDTAMQRQLWTSDHDAQRVIEGSLSSYRTGIPLQRIASAQDIAKAVFFLLGDAANHITMHELCVDGGATLGV